MRFKTTHLSALLTVAILFPSVAAAQTVEWIRQFGSVGLDKGQSVSTDALGNVYISGYAGGDIDGAGPGTNGNGNDAFVSKYDSSGVLAWTRQLGTSRADGSGGVTTDASGNVYITGWTQGDIVGAGVGSGVNDAFITKYDSRGVLAWTRQLGTSEFDISFSVSADAFGNIYIAGETRGDLDGAGAGTNAGMMDAFISKYNSSGTLAWTKQFGTSDIDGSRGVTTDAFGNVYVSGYTDGDLEGTGAGTSAGRYNYDAFVRKYDSSGTLAWTKQLGTSGSDVSVSVATDAFGNVYISGDTDGDIDGTGAGTHAGRADAFVSKYDSSGVLAWTRQLGTSGYDSSAGVSTDAYGNVYISGRTAGDLDGAGPGTHAGRADVFVSKYDRSGTLAWTWQLGTIRNDEGYGVSADAFGNVYVSGWTLGDLDGAGAETSAGREDVFLIKLQVGPEPQVVELVPRGSEWSYFDNGTNQGTAWRDWLFDDSAWQSGPAELGYGDGDEATEVSFGGDGSNKHVTTYFRRWFEVDDASRVLQLTLELLRDDGAAVYLNGVEVRRDNLNPNAPYDDLATDVVGGADESTFFLSSIDPALLRDGMNLLAVEVHQANGNSSDISFDLQLTATINPIPEPGTFSLLVFAVSMSLCRRRVRRAC